jgi:hypothetical protein
MWNMNDVIKIEYKGSSTGKETFRIEAILKKSRQGINFLIDAPVLLTLRLFIREEGET